MNWASGAEMVALGYFFTSQGFTDEHNHLFLARGVVMSKAGAATEESEGIVACRAFTPAEFRRMVAGRRDQQRQHAESVCTVVRAGVGVSGLSGVGFEESQRGRTEQTP